MRDRIKGLLARQFIARAGLVAGFWLAVLGAAAAILLDYIVAGVALSFIAGVVWMGYGPWLHRNGLRQ